MGVESDGGLCGCLRATGWPKAAGDFEVDIAHKGYVTGSPASKRVLRENRGPTGPAMAFRKNKR